MRAPITIISQYPKTTEPTSKYLQTQTKIQKMPSGAPSPSRQSDDPSGRCRRRRRHWTEVASVQSPRRLWKRRIRTGKITGSFFFPMPSYLLRDLLNFILSATTSIPNLHLGSGEYSPQSGRAKRNAVMEGSPNAQVSHRFPALSVFCEISEVLLNTQRVRSKSIS